MPDVSVIVATFNGERFLAKTLDSVLSNGSDLDIEIVVVNDGSSDSSPEIIASYGPKVQVVNHEKNLGIDKSYSDGVAASTAKYFKVLDHDDLIPKNVLDSQKKVLDSNDEIGAVYGPARLIDSNGKEYASRGFVSWPPILDNAETLRKLCISWRTPFFHGSGLIRRESFDELGGKFDFDFLVSILRSEWKVGYMDFPVLHYRTHENNHSRTLEYRIELAGRLWNHAAEIHTNPLVLAAQRAYWTLLLTAKTGYLQLLTRK